MRQAEATHLPNSRELVLNWHVTEACNYGCRYCYAKWDNAESGRELIHDWAGTTRLLQELQAFFAPGSATNPLTASMEWTSVRLNLAGGEPLLYGRQVLRIAALARELGFGVSIITNASLLMPALAEGLAGYLSLLGVSLDSASSDSNREIGRLDRRGRQITPDTLEGSLAAARRINPELRLKINTVVNALNCDEDMTPLIRRLAPEKWKVLRMLPIVTSDLAVSDAQFGTFVQRHVGHSLPLQVEDNADMTESYIMIDPLGRFFQSADSRIGYQYSQPIPRVGAVSAFPKIALSLARYLSRYSSTGTVR
ncbi:GTP 3',8-cyclase [Cupriavidus laharis]|uniref:S-adenosylmethionine-dependent nucleotide dehydratase n=1 Tax=Cupriavidus laharis TaxID=151654 RepID=A0ABN7YJX9_9BURK|nr:viperin family antiviral radical SAM protein [Cupriavidus laharis]CAG9172455.1 GTP 3',8-cyclase [Cupriavidus laharis]